MAGQHIKFKDVPHSSEDDQKIINFTAGLAVAVALSHFIPGFDYLQAAGMVIDVIDPYNYNNSFTRDGLNKLSQDTIDDLIRRLNDPQIRQPIFDKICQQYNCTNPSATITPDTINNIIDHYLSYWKQQMPTIKQGCYGDLATKGTFSGAPTDDCYPVYKQTYNDYYTKNHDAYQNGDYSTEKVFYNLIVGVKINSFRKNVFTICGIVWVLFFLIFIFILIYKWLKQR